MSKLQIAVVNVEGDGDIIRDALKSGLAVIGDRNGRALLPESPMPTDAEIGKIAGSISNNTVRRAVAAVKQSRRRTNSPIQ